jgi:mevalonate kinase
MSLKKLEAIEKKIKTTPQIDAKIKEDLLDLMRSLKTELADIKNEHPKTADSIVDQTHSSAEQILCKNNSGEQKILQENIDDLQKTVDEFEASHPKLVQVVNRICMMLSDIGI